MKRSDRAREISAEVSTEAVEVATLEVKSADEEIPHRYFRVKQNRNGCVEVIGKRVGKFTIIRNGCLKVCRDEDVCHSDKWQDIPGLKAFARGLAGESGLANLHELTVMAASDPNSSMPKMDKFFHGGYGLEDSSFDIIWNEKEGRVSVVV